MPQFRAFDFLSEAQRKNQVFLSYFLVAVPFHLETVDQYAHNGSVGNDSFRKPWLYEDGGIFVYVLEDYGLPSQEAVSKDIIHNERPYEESSRTQWTVERFSMEDDIMVIPSSNPESPQITNEERFQLQSSLLSSMNNSDTLSDDETILALQGCSWTYNQSEDEDFLLEVPIACFDSFAEPVPHIKKLCLHLKKKQVKDPFLDSSGNPVCQSHFFRRDCTFLTGCETKSFEGSIKKNVLTEDFLTENDFVPEKAKDDLYLELPVGTPTGKTAPPVRECLSPLVESGSLQETTDTNLQKDFSVLNEFNRATCASTGREKYFLKKVNFEEEFSQIEVKKGTRDEFAHTYMHEVPAVITMGNSPPPPFPSPFDKPSDVELYDIDWEESRQIVSPDTMLKIVSQQWRDEKYFGAISSLLVKEPTIEETVESKPSLSLHQELKEQLNLTSETGLEPSTREVLSDDLGIQLVAHRLQSLNQSFPKVETFLQEEARSKNWAQKLDMKVLPISLNEDDVSYTKLSVSALCGQGVSKQRSLSKSAMEATVPRTMSVSSKIASMVRTSKQELEEKETIDATTMDKKAEENVENCQRQKSFAITDSKSHHASNKPLLQDQQLMTDEGPLTVSSQNSPKVKRETKQPSKRKSFLDDQLNDFLFLTGVTSGYEKSFKRVKNEWKNDKDGDETKDQEQINKHDVADKTDTAPQKEEARPPVAKVEENIQGDEPQVKKKKKNKSKTVIIKIPDYYQKVLDVIEETGSPIVHHLQREGNISESVPFKSLTADDIRAQIKQVYEDAGIKTKKDCSNAKLKSLAQLYVCLATFEVALYCSLTSAIVGLSAMLQKYQFIIGDSLDGLRQDLSKVQCSLDESCQPHPKMVEMARQISHWFKKKVEKAGEDQDLKILVILKRESARLSESIVTTLTSIKGLRAVSLDESTPASPMITSKALDSHNCLVVTASQLHQDFLWAQFSLVVEYEFQESPSVWQTICVRQNIRHMGLCIERKSVGEFAVVKDETKVCQADGSSEQYCLKLLCSTKVTESSKLIHYLESRYNIMVLERNYNKILPSLRPSLVYADIIVDVITGIVLLSFEEVLSLGVEGLTHKVNLLSQQFEVVWLLISIDNENKSILHNKAFRQITCQLYSTFAQYSKTGSQYEVKILFGCTIQELGDAIHMICKKAEENISSAWHKEDWIKRQCLTAQPSKHEVFLMQFPSINAFTAQVLLTSAPLCKLLANYSADVLVTMAPWIPIKFLKIFEDYLKKGQHFMGMTGTLSKTDWVSKEPLLDQSGFDHAVPTSLPGQYGQARKLQHDGHARPPHSDRSHHVSEWNVKEEPSDILRSDFNLNDEAISKDSISSPRYSFQQPVVRHYHPRSALDLFAVKEENPPNFDSSVRNIEMTDGYETNYNQPLQYSTGTADSLMVAVPTDNAALRGQHLPELTAVNTLPYNTSSRLYNPGTLHPSRMVTSHNPNDLSHHLHQRVHPNQMAESYQRSAVLNTNTRFNLPPQLGYDREFYAQHGPGYQGEMDPQGLKMQMSGAVLSSSLFEEMGQKKRHQPVDGVHAQGLAHGPVHSQYSSSASESHPTIPSKHRRVSYQKVPGMPDGQTQLTFL